MSDSWFKPSYDIVEILTNKIINNPNFNSDEWSIFQGEQLIACGKLIISEIERKRNGS